MVAQDPSSPSLIRRLQKAGALLLALVLAWSAFAPLRYPTRERDLAFPRGQAARVPDELRLTLGVRDVLVLHNRDLAPHVFGQVRVAPDHAFRLPFEQAGVFVFACDAVPGERITVRVGPYPDPGWSRLAWRLRALLDALRTMPRVRPEE